MSKGPSPLIPFLLVMTTLGFLLHGAPTFTVLVVVPVVALLSLHQITQSLVVPLAVALTVYTITKMFIGPMVLMLIKCFMISVYASCFEFSQGGYGYPGDDHGMGFVLLFAVFLELYVMFSQGFEQWGLVVISVLFFLFCNF